MAATAGGGISNAPTSAAIIRCRGISAPSVPESTFSNTYYYILPLLHTAQATDSAARSAGGAPFARGDRWSVPLGLATGTCGTVMRTAQRGVDRERSSAERD